MIEIHENCRPWNLWWKQVQTGLLKLRTDVNMMDQATYLDDELRETFIDACKKADPLEPIFVYVSDVDCISVVDDRLHYLVENDVEYENFLTIGKSIMRSIWVRSPSDIVIETDRRVNRIITITDIERGSKTFRDSVVAYFNVEQKLIDTSTFKNISYEIYSPNQADFSPFNTINFNGFAPNKKVARVVAESKLFVYTMDVLSTPWRAIDAIRLGCPFLLPNNKLTDWMPSAILYSSIEELEQKIETILLMDENSPEYQNLIEACQHVECDFAQFDSILTLLEIRDTIKERRKQ